MTSVLSGVRQPIRAVLNRLDNLPPPHQQRLIFWVGGLAPLATNVITPIVTHYRFKNSGLSREEQVFNVRQETARQIVSGALQVISFFGGAWLMGKTAGEQSRTLVSFLGGTLAAFISYSFIRPLVSSEIILRWLYTQDTPSPLRRGVEKNPFSYSAQRQQQRFSAYLAHAEQERQRIRKPLAQG